MSQGYEQDFIVDDPLRSEDGMSQGSVRTGVDIKAVSFYSSTSSHAVAKAEYLPHEGIYLYFDYIKNIYSHFHHCRITFSLQNITTSIVDPILVGKATCKVDPENDTKHMAVFGKSTFLKGVQAHPSTNLVVEIQVPKPKAVDGTTGQFVSLGWTVINIFDSYRKL